MVIAYQLYVLSGCIYVHVVKTSPTFLHGNEMKF